MTNLDTLPDGPQAAIRAATEAYIAGGSIKAWQEAMRRAITSAHTAAYIAAQVDRIGVDPSLIRPNALSRIERAELKAIIERQLKYFDRFVADVQAGRMSPAQILARADMYGDAVRGSYYAMRYGDWDIPAHLLPGAQQCKARCLCRISVRDNGDGTGVLLREMGGTEHHCVECPPLAGEHPVKRRKI